MVSIPGQPVHQLVIAAANPEHDRVLLGRFFDSNDDGILSSHLRIRSTLRRVLQVGDYSNDRISPSLINRVHGQAYVAKVARCG